MRRPSPLPPAPQRPQPKAPAPAAPEPVATEPEDAATTETERLALVTAITAPIALPVDDPHALGSEPDEPVLESDSGAAVGLRAVWAAARARRKALRAEVRRFTVRQRRRRATWIGAAASLVLLVLVTLGAAYSPLFAVERIRVVGAERLDAAAVEAAMSGQLGTPLPLVDESAVKAALLTFPLVESYSLEGRPPHELVVRIIERTPVGYLETRAGFSLVDAAGVVLATAAAPGPEAPVFTIEGGAATAAFLSAGAVMRSLPESIRVQVTAVTASTPDDVTLILGGTNTRVVWGSADESVRKGISLASMMLARPPATVSEYDVSSPSAVVVR